MSKFSELAVPVVATTTIRLKSPATLKLAGTLAMRDPAGDLGPFLKTLHAAAMADGVDEVRVDVSQLRFVNSSSLRLFVDWASWLRSENESRRYRLKFLTNRHVTWQKTAFSALVVLAGPVIEVEPVN